MLLVCGLLSTHCGTDTATHSELLALSAGHPLAESVAIRTEKALNDDDIAHLEFLVIGDQGNRGALQDQVSEGMSAVREKYGADFVIGVGDNFYPDGVTGVTDSHWLETFENVYAPESFPIRFYMTLGNHDYAGNPDVQVDYWRDSVAVKTHGLAEQRWVMKSRYYGFEEHDPETASLSVAFFALDTEPMDNRQDAFASNVGVFRPNLAAGQLQEVEEYFSSADQQWKVAFGHHPPYSNDSSHGDSVAIQRLLVPILEKNNVSALFGGHSHNLEALGAKNGVHYFVGGAGSKVRPLNTANAPFGYDEDGGFIWCRATMDTLRVVFFNKLGETLPDQPHFAIPRPVSRN